MVVVVVASSGWRFTARCWSNRGNSHTPVMVLALEATVVAEQRLQDSDGRGGVGGGDLRTMLVAG